MYRSVTTLCVIFVLIATLSNSVSGRPTDNLVRHKRQSDQRLAELETLLALQKYRHHRLRPEHKGSQPGYGVIDFNTIGRRKKSTRFSPGERSFGQDIRDPAFIQAAKSLGEEEVESLPPTGDSSLNEKIDSLLSIKSLLIRDPTLKNKLQVAEKSSPSVQGIDLYEDKK